MIENGKTISKQTYSAARKKLNPQIFKILNKNYLNRIYGVKRAYKTFKAHILVADDSSKPTLPNIETLRRWFGGEKYDDEVLKSTNANMNVLYDCLNHFILDLVIDKYKTSEKKTLLKENLKNIVDMEFLKDKLKIFIFDRGYPSLELFYQLLYQEKQSFMIRLKKKATIKKREKQ